MKSFPNRPMARYQSSTSTTRWRHISHPTMTRKPKHLWYSLLTSPTCNIGGFRVKALSIIFLFLLLGCAPSTQNLIDQAHVTGDWSLVNERIEAERRRAERLQSCRFGTTEWCDSGDEGCSCVNIADLRTAMDRMRDMSPVRQPGIRRR